MKQDPTTMTASMAAIKWLSSVMSDTRKAMRDLGTEDIVALVDENGFKFVTRKDAIAALLDGCVLQKIAAPARSEEIYVIGIDRHCAIVTSIPYEPGSRSK